MDEVEFGRYRLIELLGRGGMGEVWRAHDTETDRVVALKLLPPNLSEDEEFQRRFRREAHAAARLSDPHVIPIHHYGEIDGRLYVDMRLIEGRDLQSVLADGPLDPVRAVRIIGQVAEALHAAHKVGLLHRDIKPSNILLNENDFAYLIDFGIARALDETRMTKSGYMLGTFQYIAPERLDTAGEEDARADIYSLACVLYECLIGDPPFSANTMARLVAAHLNTPPPRPSINRPEVPAQVDEVIATGMAKNPDDRYATTVELADAAAEAITVPIQRSTPSSTRIPATEPAGNRFAALPTAAGQQDGPVERIRSETISTPWWRQRQPSLIAAAIVTLLAVAGITGYLLRPSANTSPPSTTARPSAAPTVATTTTPPPPPPVMETALDGLLLSPDQVNAAMSATGMTVNQTWNTMMDVGTNPAAPPECLPVSGEAEAGAYDGSGWTAVHGQLIMEPGHHTHYVQQFVVLFPSVQAATAFVSASSQSWQACANRSYTDTSTNPHNRWNVGPVSTTNGTVTATTTLVANREAWACQRALTARNNVVIDVGACTLHNTTDQGITVATQIASKVPT
ncbi:serine/threonine-protein kinase PknH/PknJ [Mycobacterium sp. 1164966.3]|uniref:serine/threonine-protein kinase PknH/PknJ n=1 Tax=Mycobacterium sp. 1164966.3 TaxID=1856861 RepID=UPI0009EED415|nr:serine/threonine-protein kinase PknH/PknJ [Mycobacterium sp. 1164966.3]